MQNERIGLRPSFLMAFNDKNIPFLGLNGKLKIVLLSEKSYKRYLSIHKKIVIFFVNSDLQIPFLLNSSTNEVVYFLTLNFMGGQTRVCYHKSNILKYKGIIFYKLESRNHVI